MVFSTWNAKKKKNCLNFATEVSMVKTFGRRLIRLNFESKLRYHLVNREVPVLKLIARFQWQFWKCQSLSSMHSLETIEYYTVLQSPNHIKLNTCFKMQMLVSKFCFVKLYPQNAKRLLLLYSESSNWNWFRSIVFWITIEARFDCFGNKAIDLKPIKLRKTLTENR